MTYQTPLPTSGSPGTCSFTSTNKAQYLFTINRNTILGSSYVKNITVNGSTVTTSSSSLESLNLYIANVI